MKKLTTHQRSVLHALAHGCHFGAQVCRVTKLSTGIVYPILKVLTDRGYVTRRDEDRSEIMGRLEWRPDRVFYSLNITAKEFVALISDTSPTRKGRNLSRV